MLAQGASRVPTTIHGGPAGPLSFIRTLGPRRKYFQDSRNFPLTAPPGAGIIPSCAACEGGRDGPSGPAP